MAKQASPNQGGASYRTPRLQRRHSRHLVFADYCVGLGDSGGLGNSPDGFLIEMSSKSNEGTTNETNGPVTSPEANSSIIMPLKGFGFGARNGDVYTKPSLPAARISLKLDKLSSAISTLRSSLSRPYGKTW